MNGETEDREFKRLMIRGQVQKIGYRVWAERESLALGLKGWVRNRHDGTVELVISGPPPAVRTMIERCWKGPPLAAVESIDVEEASLLDLGHRRTGEGFSLLPTA
jgi:acylphosphatase